MNKDNKGYKVSMTSCITDTAAEMQAPTRRARNFN